MSFRFRRSFKVAPGVRINVGKKSGSVSVGSRGANVNIGSKGIHGNVGVPGTGISSRQKIAGGGSKAGGAAGASGSLKVGISLQDDGSVEFTDGAGNPLPDRLLRQLKKEKGDAIRQWLEDQCQLWNEDIEEILNIHLHTLPPDPPAKFERAPFNRPEPTPPEPKKVGILGKIWPGREERIKEENRRRREAFEEKLATWNTDRERHEKLQTAQSKRFSAAQSGETEAMGEVLQKVLTEIDWPRETLFDFRIEPDGGTLWLDVDLPEIEDLPNQTARPSKRGYRILIKDKSAKQLREEYRRHVHGIGFRVLGEIFHLFPAVEVIVLSAYSQRLNEATGHVEDDYLYSVKAERTNWERLQFKNVSKLDLPMCFEQFDLRRNMTKTGIFRAIEPFEPQEVA